jgi:hypothetical protein
VPLARANVQKLNGTVLSDADCESFNEETKFVRGDITAVFVGG